MEWMDFMEQSFVAKLLMPLLVAMPLTAQAVSESHSLLPDLAAAGARSAPVNASGVPALKVNNRLLVTVLGHPITVLDVQRHMEAQFFANFPQYRSQPEVKWDFFQARWRETLDEMINEELILADAADKDINVSDGDVREEMIKRFGVDLAVAMDAMGMELEEAWEIVRRDLMSQRMLGGMVFFPAFCTVKADDVRLAYQQAVAQSLEEATCRYKVVSIKAADSSAAEVAAALFYQHMKQQGCDPEHILAQLNQAAELPQGVTCSISEEYSQPMKSINSSYRDVLSKLERGAFSQPIAQHSRAQQTTVHRILCCLDKNDASTLPSFAEVAQNIHDRLVQQAADSQLKEYTSKLRQRYGIRQEEIDRWAPVDLRPFQVRS